VTCIGPFTASYLAKRLRLAVSEVELAALEAEGLLLRGRFTAGATELEWCERTLLARIHRLTLGRLRREIEPVSTADLMRFLFRWQHVHAGAHVLGVGGLSEVLGQLQGFQAAAGAWESEILPARVAQYERGMLDQLCLSGEIAWGRLSCASVDPEVPRRRAAPTRLTPLALCRREDLPWLLDATRGPPEPVGDRASRLHALLEQRGALFFHELLRKGDLPAGELEAGLWDLVAAGLASSDGFAAVRFLITPQRRPGAAAQPLSAGGRWSLLRPPCEEAAPARIAFGEPPEWLSKLARQYLRRYGVVFRDLLAREPRCPPWRELARIYRRMEARGELRGGRFAQAFSGEQFALPEALDALRTVRRTRPLGTERVTVSAADPLNLIGILTPGSRVPAQSGAQIEFIDGVPGIEPQLVSA
jgi:ATP-dependent Lhr-like helicase